MRTAFFLLLVFASNTLGQTPNDAIELKTPNSEVEDAILFLTDLQNEGRDPSFIRFFSTYNIQDKKEKEDVVLTLSFVLHSLIAIGKDDEYNSGGFTPLAKRDEEGNFTSYQKVPDSDSLWWIDIRDYNWTQQSWENISKFDGYFAEPVVRYDRSGVLRLLAGNAVVRADWFIVHATDQTRQSDNKIDNTFYEELLYAQSDKPKNLDEWVNHWGGIDLKDAQNRGNEAYSLVTEGTQVARHNRILKMLHGQYGPFFYTFDVINMRGKRNYIDSFLLNSRIGGDPDLYDGGEGIGINYLGGEVYMIYATVFDEKDKNKIVDTKLVDFGDTTIVRHISDIIGDNRVRNPYSCFDCHAAGPIPPENTIREFLESQGNFITYDKADSARIKKNYASGRFEYEIKPAQDRFAFFVNGCNGLTPEENGALFLRAVSKYSKPIKTIEEACFEVGVTKEEFIEKVSKAKFGNSLKILIQGGSISKEVWESPPVDGIPGAFQQAMIAINGVTLIEDSVEVQNLITVYRVIEENAYVEGSSKDHWKKNVRKNDMIMPLNQNNNSINNDGNTWYKVKTSTGSGFIRDSFVEKIEIPKSRLGEVIILEN